MFIFGLSLSCIGLFCAFDNEQFTLDSLAKNLTRQRRVLWVKAGRDDVLGFDDINTIEEHTTTSSKSTDITKIVLFSRKDVYCTGMNGSIQLNGSSILSTEARMKLLSYLKDVIPLKEVIPREGLIQSFGRSMINPNNPI
jgi:hypothetical protein